MNKSVLLPIIGAFALSILSGCNNKQGYSGGGKSNKEQIVETAIDEVVNLFSTSSYKRNIKYHVTGVTPYSFKRGDGQSYPSESYYFFAHRTDGTGYVAARVCTSNTFSYTSDGFKLTMDSSEVADRVEKDFINQGATVKCSFDVYFFQLQFQSYSNFAVELVSFTQPAD